MIRTMREIKFRGKALNGEKWYYGSLIDYGDPTFCDIVRFNDDNEAIHEYVDINTVGQFTSLYDKNGKEIYEGDIIVRKMKKGTWGTHEGEPLEVVFKNGSFGVRLYRWEVYEEFEWILQHGGGGQYLKDIIRAIKAASEISESD